MTNYPKVLLENQDLITQEITFRALLDMTIPYREVLVERLTRLNAFTANNSLEGATALINEAGVECTSKEVDKVLFGEKGMIPSTQASIEGRNTNRPKNYSGKLTRVNGSPYFQDQFGRRFVRGVIVEGNYPYKVANNTLTAIRNCIEQNLSLPRYIRHELGEGDSTYDRDINNNPR